MSCCNAAWVGPCSSLKFICIGLKQLLYPAKTLLNNLRLCFPIFFSGPAQRPIVIQNHMKENGWNRQISLCISIISWIQDSFMWPSSASSRQSVSVIAHPVFLLLYGLFVPHDLHSLSSLYSCLQLKLQKKYLSAYGRLQMHLRAQEHENNSSISLVPHKLFKSCLKEGEQKTLNDSTKHPCTLFT